MGDALEELILSHVYLFKWKLADLAELSKKISGLKAKLTESRWYKNLLMHLNLNA